MACIRYVNKQQIYVLIKGGFYSERAGEFVISPNKCAKLFSWAKILIFFSILNGSNQVKKGPEAALKAQKRH